MKSARLFALGLALTAFAGCKDRHHAPTSAGGVPIVQIPDDDPHLALAAAQAKKEWPTFLAAFKRPAGKRGFAVKTAFPTKGGGTEYMWVMVTSVDEQAVTGTLDDAPINDIGHKEGDTITVPARQVEDWVFMDGNTRVGGFSIDIMNQMSEEQKKK